MLFFYSLHTANLNFLKKNKNEKHHKK